MQKSESNPINRYSCNHTIIAVYSGMEPYYPDRYPVSPKLFAWHDPDFRAKVKVGDTISFIDAYQLDVTMIRKNGLMLGDFITVQDPNDPTKELRVDSPSPGWFLSWDELIERECIIVQEPNGDKELTQASS